MRSKEVQVPTLLAMPNDAECEATVLGSLLADNIYIEETRDLLTLDCFYTDLHKSIYASILSIFDKGNTPDILTVVAELKKDIPNVSPVSIAEVARHQTASINQYVLHLRELMMRRNLITIGTSLASKAATGANDVADAMQEARASIDNIYTIADTHIRTAHDYLGEVYDRITANANGTTIQGTPTGFMPVDSRGGLQPGNLIIVAADSSQGKTSFADAIALNATKQDFPLAFYSLEMTGSQLLIRLTAMESGIPATNIANMPLSPEQTKQFDAAAKIIDRLPLYFDDRSTSSLEAICNSTRSLKLKENIKGIIVDYLQLLPRNGKRDTSDEAALADSARQLKNLAKSLGIFVILLSQLSRDPQNPVPTLNRLRGSGQINEAADVTLLLYRPEKYGKSFSEPFTNIDTHNMGEVIVAKNRSGDCYSFLCSFEPETTLFKYCERPMKAAKVQSAATNVWEGLTL